MQLGNQIDNENDDNDRHFFVYFILMTTFQFSLDLSPLMINWNVVIKIKSIKKCLSLSLFSLLIRINFISTFRQFKNNARFSFIKIYNFCVLKLEWYF